MAQVRLKSAGALGQLRDSRAIGPLIAALGDINGGVRLAAAGALEKLGKAAYAPLLEAFKTGDPALRSVALGVLARSRSAATSELLIAALDDPVLQVRREAARLLARRKERKAVGRLIAALDRPEVGLGLYVWTLGEIGDPRAFEPVEAMLGSRDFHVRSAAVNALQKIDNARAVDLLYQRLEDPARDDRDQLAHTLVEMDLLDAIRSLVKTAAGGRHDILMHTRERLRSAQDQMRVYTQGLRAGDTAPGRGEVEQARVELMRRLESELRDLGRKPRDA
jgi:HEAT repeat protein